jgi:hypothetical protein
MNRAMLIYNIQLQLLLLRLEDILLVAFPDFEEQVETYVDEWWRSVKMTMTSLIIIYEI